MALAQQSQMSQSFYNNQPPNQPPTNNPYRFAQLYNDPFSPNKPCNRSQSTLGSPNQNYFSPHGNNTLPYSNGGGGGAGPNKTSKSNMMETTSNTLGPGGVSGVGPGMGQQYYQNNASTISYQSQQTYQPPSSLTSPYTESLLGMMNKEFNNHNYSFKMQQQQQQQQQVAAAAAAQQHYDSNISMAQQPNGKAAKSMFLQQQQQHQSFIGGRA